MFLRWRYKEQLDACFNWMREVATPEDVIEVRLPIFKAFFRFEFPLRSLDKPERASLAMGSEPAFLITTPTNHPPKGFLSIFTSPELVVWENFQRTKEFVPIRHGLSEFEKKLLLNISREALTEFLNTGNWPSPYKSEYLKEFPYRLHKKSDVCVALWVDGRLRGSIIETGRHLVEGIVTATASASRDPRFSPVNIEDLPNTRIEITLISPLRIPLSKKEYHRNEIYPIKGYVLTEGNKSGWYLPELFNIRRCGTLKDFIVSLATEKAKVGAIARSRRIVKTFEVEDFIESAKGSRALSLQGPAVFFGSVKFPLEEVVQNRLELAAQWLLFLIREDGSMPAILSPFSEQIRDDTIRQAFVCLALSEYYGPASSPEIIQKLHAAAQYLEKINYDGQNLFLFEAYRGQFAIARGDRSSAERISKKLAEVPLPEFEPITYAQTLTLLGKLDERQHVHVSTLLTSLERHFKEDSEKDRPMNIAVWAETAHACSMFSDPAVSKSIVEWMLQYQDKDGSFPRDTRGGLQYTRSIGKIFEILSLWPKTYSEELTRALSWLLAMQYTEDSSYFVPKETRAKFLGGFRHDMLNADAWIDAAGHIVLGGARLKKYETSNGRRNS